MPFSHRGHRAQSVTFCEPDNGCLVGSVNSVSSVAKVGFGSMQQIDGSPQLVLVHRTACLVQRPFLDTPL